MRFMRKFLFVYLVISIFITASGCTAFSSTQPVSTSPNTDKEFGQVRNNKLEITKKSFDKFWEDPVFKNFKDTGKNLQDYNLWLLDQAKGKGINISKLQGVLETAKALKGKGITIYPVVIETGVYEGKESFIFVFTWELASEDKIDGKVDISKEIVQPLGHIFVVALEADSKKVIFQESCK